jgi:mono/diheme cytochrome c family protein
LPLVTLLHRLVLTALFVAGAAAAGEHDDKPADGPDKSLGSATHFEEVGGEAIYTHVCTGCHMADAKGATGAGTYPALAGDPKLEAAGYPVAMVLHGQKAMPAIGVYLSDAQVADVVNYVRTHFGNDYKDVVTEAEVKAAR